MTPLMERDLGLRCTSDHGTAIADICSITKPTMREGMDFTRIPLIDGKTFWELENELEWV